MRLLWSSHKWIWTSVSSESHVWLTEWIIPNASVSFWSCWEGVFLFKHYVRKAYRLNMIRLLRKSRHLIATGLKNVRRLFTNTTHSVLICFPCWMMEQCWSDRVSAPWVLTSFQNKKVTLLLHAHLYPDWCRVLQHLTNTDNTQVLSFISGAALYKASLWHYSVGV